jgi:protein-S-isoprenylcysteine O-methyltransferase Ste14
MSPFEPLSDHTPRCSSLVTSSPPWVVVQLALALVIFWPFNIWPRTPVGLMPGLLLMVAGGVLMIWTLRHNHSGNWQVAPAVRSGARLITDGPYRWVRHPMYVAVLVLTLGFVLLDRHVADGVAWVLLAGLFAIKSRIEEASLAKRFPCYEAYRRRTGAFWPRRAGRGEPPV